MIEKIKIYLRELLSIWRGRWAMRGWRERLDMLFIPVAALVGLLIAIWLALWFFLGPPSIQIEDVEVDLDRSLSLAGPDVNANGIRDDIDNYIKVLSMKKAYSKPQVKALEQSVKTMQGLITVDLGNAKELKRVVDSSGKSSRCLYQKFDEDDAYELGSQIEKLTANTRQRAIAYMKFNHAMDGTVSTSPKGDVCES